MKTIASLFVLGCLLGTTLPAWAQPSKKPIYLIDVVDNQDLPGIKNRFERVKQQLMGHFGNRRQVQEKPGMGETEQEFIIVPVMKDRTNEFWVYLEFFSPSMHETPLDQRVERYVRLDRDTIRMEVYYLKEPKRWVNEWKKTIPCEGLTREDLVRDPACDLLMVYNEDKSNTYTTLIPEDVECSLKVAQGKSKYVLLWFELSDKGYNMQFRFYDKDKQLVHEGHVLEFDRLDWHSKDYINYAPGVKPPKTPKQPAKKEDS